MGHKQLNARAARQLNQLERKLSIEAERLKETQSRYDFLFRQVFDIFDHEFGTDQPARFVCDDGYTIARIIPQNKPKIDGEGLVEAIGQRLSSLAATRMINRIVSHWTPVVDQKTIAHEIQIKRLDPDLVAEFISTPKASPRHYRDRTSKHDKQSLEAGILESPTEAIG